MSSYVIQKQSRGVGAIAACDLGAIRVEDPLTEPHGGGVPPRAPPLPSRPPSRPGGPRTRTPIRLISRPRRGAGPSDFAPGTQGPLLQRPRIKVVTHPNRPAPPAPPSHPTTDTKTQQAVDEPVPIISYPPVTYPAGILPGPVPGVRPLPDEFVEEDVITAASPAPTPNKFLIGGVLVAAGLFTWYLMRKR